MKYSICIGEIHDLCSGSNKPNKFMEINEDQFKIIRMFSDTEIMPDMNTIYVINKIRFQVIPELEFVPPTEKEAITVLQQLGNSFDIENA